LYKRLKIYLREHEHVNTSRFPEVLGIKNVLLSKILLEEMVEEGLLCIDESDLDLHYYQNLILNK
jgi:hypothetical protein